MSRPQVFVDTLGWVPIACRQDAAQEQAARLRREAIARGALLVTSDLVLAASLTRLRYHVGLREALVLADLAEVLLEREAMDMVHGGRELWLSALTWFRRSDDQRFSFVDCTCFAIVHARGSNDALTADRHFATAGFTPLGA